MHLAKDKYGNIGRKIPSSGTESKIQQPMTAEEQTDLYVSQSSVVKQDIKNKLEEAKAQAQESANFAKRKMAQLAKEDIQKQKTAEVKQYQKASKIDPTQDVLKTYFAKQMSVSETKKVLNDLSPASLPAAPANFSASGGNVQYVRGTPVTGGDQWNADFRTQMIVGNPLTRDGVFGPGITDYDRFVKGIDVNQTDVVKIVGGTILGRYQSQDINLSGSTMGSVSDFFSNLASGVSTGISQGTQEALSKLPSQVSTTLSSSLQDMLNKGLAKKNPDGTITVVRESQAPPTIIQSGISTTTLALGGLAFASALALILLIKRK